MVFQPEIPVRLASAAKSLRVRALSVAAVIVGRCPVRGMAIGGVTSIESLPSD
jgi:hypothetical protein